MRGQSTAQHSASPTVDHRSSESSDDPADRWLTPADQPETSERVRNLVAFGVGIAMVAFLGFFFLSNFFGKDDLDAVGESVPAYYEFGSRQAAIDARSSIADSLTTAFDPDVPEPEWLAAVAVSTRPSASLSDFVATCGSSDVAIDDLRFLSPSSATMFFSFQNTRIAGGDWLSFNGSADLVDDTWVISADTIDSVLGRPDVCG